MTRRESHRRSQDTTDLKPGGPSTQSAIRRISEARGLQNMALAWTFSALGGTRTPNLLIRSQMLYPIELQAPGDL
jgi:hypothetical protein